MTVFDLQQTAVSIQHTYHLGILVHSCTLIMTKLFAHFQQLKTLFTQLTLCCYSKQNSNKSV